VRIDVASSWRHHVNGAAQAAESVFTGAETPADIAPVVHGTIQHQLGSIVVSGGAAAHGAPITLIGECTTSAHRSNVDSVNA
jgi:hypothetical protein